MKFRPCIDIHNGKVKQIVGGSLQDERDRAQENFVSERSAAFYADLFRRDNLKGGHVILLNPPSSPYFEEDRRQAADALKAWPGGLQVGGGVTAENAPSYIEAGASHVIVTSYVFKDGEVQWKNLEKLASAVGAGHIVLDVSCRKKDGKYYIVTDRWQRFTKVQLGEEIRCGGCSGGDAGICPEYPDYICWRHQQPGGAGAFPAAERRKTGFYHRQRPGSLRRDHPLRGSEKLQRGRQSQVKAKI